MSDLKEVFVSNDKLKKLVNKLLSQGVIRKIGPKLYTQNLKDNPAALVKKYLWQIVGEYFPGAMLSDRTAIENRPDNNGNIYLISTKTRKVILPGVTIYPRIGHPPIDSDKQFIKTLHLPSLARSLLENMQVSRARNGASPRTLLQSEMEQKLFDILIKNDDLNFIREEACKIAPQLGLEKECVKLDKLIGALLGTRDHKLSSKIGAALLQNVPFDEKRASLLEKFHTYLASLAPVYRMAKYDDSSWRNLAFFEAYFSNFIEGTEFAVDEAKAIAFDGKIPASRPEDAHDIIGTYNIVSSIDEMSKIPLSFEQLLELLKRRHASVMEGRTSSSPGKFKAQGNRAGSTLFVRPELVQGTLQIGFDLYRSLECPLYKGIFMKFLISEIHPFADGNGRVSRIMMNAELVAAGSVKVIIPTIYRNNHLSALKALSQNSIAEPIVRCLDFAQKYVQNIDWSDFDYAQKMLEDSGAFMDSFEAEDNGVRLRIQKI